MIFNLFGYINFILPTIVEQILFVVAVIILFVTILLSFNRIIVNSSHESTVLDTLRFTLVVILNIATFITMIVLINEVKVITEDTAKHVLITSGTNQQQLASLHLSDNDHVYLLSQYRKKYQNENDESETINTAILTSSIIKIDNVQQLLYLKPNLSNLTVVGDGLTKQELLYLKQIDLTFNFPKTLMGPVNMSWQKQLLMGQILTVQGVFQSAELDEQQIYQVALYDTDDQQVDSLRVKHDERFTLSLLPKTTGLFAAQLKIFDENETLLVSEPIAFEIIKSVSPAIVIKQSSASFESRHIKNWAEQQGSKILLLTQVSKNKQIQQQVNFVDNNNTAANLDGSVLKNNVTKLNPDFEVLAHAWLKDFDLLIIDGRALLALNSNEQAELNKAIVDGLGLLVLVDESLVVAFEQSSPKILTQYQLTPIPSGINKNSNKRVDKQSTTGIWWENSFSNIAELTLPYKNINISAVHAKTLVYGDNRNPLVLSTNFGLGKVSISLINHSYQWSISGQKTAYSQYWQYLMTQMSRNTLQSYWKNEAGNEVSYLGEYFRLCAQSNEENLTASIIIQRTFTRESTYCGIDWSTKLGWQQHSLYQKQNNTSVKSTLFAQKSRYIYPKSSWLTWQQAQKHQASRQVHKENKNVRTVKIYQPINKDVIWLIFFICLSFLWIEQKFFK